jgi:formate-dependent phosphoribosylglycinamide formyltransferase (GAR transformylase)
MKKNKILNIGSGYYQSSIIKECKKMGYEVISCDICPNAPGLKYADKKIIVDCHSF